ncbi:MAG TPA: hypothetical protein VG498_05595 [Terriglobales bacterium]|nr:hypothetical protein [Terriglobales bacterium]
MPKLTVLLVLGFTAFMAAAEPQHLSVGSLDVAVWKPKPAPSKSGYPVIVFSHGFGGCSTQSTFLMEALAEAGYLVVAPNHKDARCGGRQHYGGSRSGGFMRPAPMAPPQVPFRNDKAWTDETYRDRHDDIEQVLDKRPPI